MGDWGGGLDWNHREEDLRFFNQHPGDVSTTIWCGGSFLLLMMKLTTLARLHLRETDQPTESSGLISEAQNTPPPSVDVCVCYAEDQKNRHQTRLFEPSFHSPHLSLPLGCLMVKKRVGGGDKRKWRGRGPLFIDFPQPVSRHASLGSESPTDFSPLHRIAASAHLRSINWAPGGGGEGGWRGFASAAEQGGVERTVLNCLIV